MKKVFLTVGFGFVYSAKLTQPVPVNKSFARKIIYSRCWPLVRYGLLMELIFLFCIEIKTLPYYIFNYFI